MRWQDGRYLQNYWTEKPVIACGRQANWRRSITRGCFVPTWLDSWPQHGTLGTQATVEKFLHQTKLTKKKSWGFSIGIADWKVIGQDLETLEKVFQSKMNGTRRVSFLGQRGYEGTWFDNKVNWMADFVAEMPDFSPEPTADQFRYGLRLKWSWSEKELSENELEEYVDHASTWRVLDEDDRVDLKEDLKGRFGRKARIDLELYFEDPVFRLS